MNADIHFFFPLISLSLMFVGIHFIIEGLSPETGNFPNKSERADHRTLGFILGGITLAFSALFGIAAAAMW